MSVHKRFLKKEIYLVTARVNHTRVLADSFRHNVTSKRGRRVNELEELAREKARERRSEREKDIYIFVKPPRDSRISPVTIITTGRDTRSLLFP